ncbi:MAG: outer membrane protein assembly factor BamA [Rhodothermales bacterium]
MLYYQKHRPSRLVESALFWKTHSDGAPRFRMYRYLAVFSLVALTIPGLAWAQAPAITPTGAGTPVAPSLTTLEILGVSVMGDVDAATESFVLARSGLSQGMTITLPGDNALAEAIRNIYRLGLFSDVQILEERRVSNGVFLAIQVVEVPKLNDYSFTGIKRSHRRDLEKEVPLIKRSAVKPDNIERSRQIIRNYFIEKGHPLANVEAQRTEVADGEIDLTFVVDRGPTVEIEAIEIEGNESLSDRKLRKKMKGTKKDAWWRIFKKASFDEAKFDEDKENILAFYNERGYFDARIVSDSVYYRGLEEGEPEMVVQLRVEEGPQYHIRNIEWEGNTLYTDEFLTSALGLEEGEVYNSKTLQQNLYQNAKSSDVSSLYYNRGYMTFRVNDNVRIVEGDSLDLHFDVFEGDIYTIGAITIAGNRQTRDHVVRRELYTVPGRRFSRDEIQESIRRLMQLNYFSQESLGAGPSIDVDEANKQVNLAYNLEESGSSQLQLSGTWGRFGLVLQLGFAFNNFSTRELFNGGFKRFPIGDGQQLSINIQTNGRFYQQYSLSFTEPWFRNKPQPVGFSTSYSRISRSPFGFNTIDVDTDQYLATVSGRVFYQRRLKWPDDKFSTSSSVRYQFYDNANLFSTLPSGISQELALVQSLTRNSTDHPFFPTAGSKLNLTGELALPLGDFIQYFKGTFSTSWNIPLAANGKLSAGFSSDFGYIASLTGENVSFERYVVGGSPFETQGSYTFYGSDIVYMRGYPAGALGPRSNGEPLGGRILNKYTSELRFNAVQTQQLSAAPYIFMDAANTWDGPKSYNPTELFRSAGVGTKLFLPILGMIELAYGYNFDQFEAINSRHDGSNRWYFQFTLGQGFGQ